MLTPGLIAPALLGLLALAALVVWLHMIRPERRVVPSLLIWLTLPDLPGAARRRRKLPPPSALLLLQLAALAALVLALARPYLGPPPPAHLVVVLDGSAPMRAAAGEGTFFDRARDDLLRDLAGRRGAPPQRVSLVLAGPVPGLLAARHAYEPAGLAPLLAGAAVGDGPADWRRVADLVRQTLVPGESVAGVLAGSAIPPELAAQIDDLALLPVAPPPLAPAPDLRLTPVKPGTWALAGTLRGDAALAGATVEIGFTSEADIGRRPPLPWKRLTPKLDAGSARIDEVLELKDPGLVTVRVQAEGRQDWPGAVARFLTAAPPARRVLYIAAADAPDQPLLRAIAAQEELELFRAEGLPPDQGGFALVIVDGTILPAAPAAPTLWIGPAGVGEGAGTTLPVADADDWHPIHPLTRGANWAALHFGPVSTRPLPEGAEVLLAGAGHPLLAVAARGGWQDIHLKFDPRRIDWGSGDALPVLAAAATDWLGLTGALRGTCTVGLPCAAEAGAFQGLDGSGGFATDAALFVPTAAGLFRSASGILLAVNPAPDRFGRAEAEAAAPEQAARALALMRYLLIAALLLLAADAALRYRLSGRRALPALAAPALVVAALAGIAFPLPFARSVAVQLLPEGAPAAAEGLSIAAGPAPRIPGSTAPADAPAPAITHAAAALDLAAALVPPHQVADIAPAAPVRAPVPARMAEALPLAGHAHLRTPPVPVAAPTRPTLTALALPANAAPGDRLALTALVHSQTAAPARIAFHANDTLLAAEVAALQPGMNRIETELPPLAVGETRFTVTVDIAGVRTSALSAIATARAGRPIAVLAPDPAHGMAFARFARAAVPGLPADSQPEIRVLDPATAPDYLRDWLDHDAIVLLNMPARAVSSRKAGLIEQAVTRHGLGLVMLGGSNAFGPGGYFATPFEALSPLSARVPREAPEVTMVFVLDRSGSMNQQVAGGTRLEMALQATVEAIGLLNPESRVGIVVFDSEARTVLPLTRAGDTDTVRAALATVDPGGGTSIAPGLTTGWDLLRGSDAQARHMIVMTDGLSQPGDFAGIAGAMRAEGVIVSAVAVGTGSDAQAVREIASAGGGSLHASDDFAALPSILSQEAMLLSSPVREGPGQPRPGDPSDPLLRGLPAGLPLIGGVVLTTAKPEARLALTTSTPDGEETPLLATWRQGNGHVLAFASDATGDWTRNWQADPAFAALWPHVLRQIRPLRPASGPWLALADTGEQIRLTLEVLDAEGAPRAGLAPVAQVATEGGPPLSLPMAEVGPGIYEAGFAPGGIGRIAARVALPATPRPAVAGRPAAAEEVAEAALYRSRPLWAEPRRNQPLRLAGGVAAAPTGWGLRLVPGLPLPWVALALVAFLAALVVYMRPPRLASRPAGAGAPVRPAEGTSS